VGQAAKVRHAPVNQEPSEVSRAAKWFRRAAERGDPQAQHNLGPAYQNGEAVEPDTVGAYAWYNIAAANITRKTTSRGTREVQLCSHVYHHLRTKLVSRL